MIKSKIVVLFFLTLKSSLIFSQDLDFRLSQIVDVYKLLPLACEDTQAFDDKLAGAGKQLFESVSLSGGQDTGCSKCHLDDKFLTDGLPISVGVGGRGEGISRMLSGEGVLVPRNSFSLFGRGLSDYRAYFWDGKILIDDKIQKLISPFGESISTRFHSPLSVAAIMPLLARDEFLGELSVLNQPESLSINEFYYQDRYVAASNYYRNLIFNSNVVDLKQISELFRTAGVNEDSFELADLGNAIAAFLIKDFSCFHTPWNDYLKGNIDSLSDSQKAGAIVFFGKGRCAACHEGRLFSDFKYHSIGVPQGGFGVSAMGQDFGRSEITLNVNDRFKFRTPPLLYVSKTPPYGHNGIFSNLESVVLHHVNPIIFYKDYEWPNEFEYLNSGKVLSSRDEILSYIDILNRQEIEVLLQFLEAL